MIYLQNHRTQVPVWVRSFLVIVAFCISCLGMAQDIAGTYQVVYDTDNSYQTYTLKLMENGNFEYHFFRKNDCNNCEEENQYGRGNWRFEKKKLYLSSTQEDLDEKYTLDLDGSTAHYIQKSARDLSDKKVPTRLKFFKSEIFWVVGKDMVKL